MTKFSLNLFPMFQAFTIWWVDRKAEKDTELKQILTLFTLETDNC